MSEKIEWYPLDEKGVAPRKLSAKEVSAVLTMLDTPGWKVFTALKAEEAQASNAIGMSLQAPEAERDRHRALYHGLQAIVCFEGMFRDAVLECEGTPLDAA